MKTTIISKLEELLQQEVGAVATEVRTLQKEYQKLWTAEFENAKQEFVDDGGKAKEFEYIKHPEDVKITSLFERFEKLKKELDGKIAAEQIKNLIVRQDIISKIRDLSSLSDNVGAAIKKLGELQTQWKATGAVSSHKYKDVQAEYSKAIEDFYYNLKIFKELQEHDLKRNYELKNEVLEKIKGLTSLENIKEAERLIKIYRNDWEDIGPVPNDKWETLKKDFKDALDSIYVKLKSHYNSIEEKKELNLQQKQQLIEKAKAIVTDCSENSNPNWKQLTEKLIALQNEWKSIGRAGAKENDKIWNEFREVCDEFFTKKKEVFNVLHEKLNELKAKKNELIKKADALKDSKDWVKTTQSIIRLQDDWKKIPSAGQDEHKLFMRFRTVCNHFFDEKKKHYEALDASFENNLVTKEEILSTINAFTLTENNTQNRDVLKELAKRWNDAGMVPMKDKKRVNDAFYNKLDELYDQMNMNHAEKIAIQFQNKVEKLMNGENAEQALVREADYLKKQIDEINGRIRTYDNNLGFFKNSKGSNDFMKEIQQKIDAEKQKVTDFTAKRKIIVAEINKLKQPANTPSN